MADSTPSFCLVVESVEISTVKNFKPGSIIDISLSESADESTIETAEILCDHHEYLNLVKKRNNAGNSIVRWLTKEVSIPEAVLYFCGTYAATYAAGVVLGVVGRALKGWKAGGGAK